MHRARDDVAGGQCSRQVMAKQNPQRFWSSSVSHTQVLKCLKQGLSKSSVQHGLWIDGGRVSRVTRRSVFVAAVQLRGSRDLVQGDGGGGGGVKGVEV